MFTGELPALPPSEFEVSVASSRAIPVAAANVMEPPWLFAAEVVTVLPELILILPAGASRAIAPGGAPTIRFTDGEVAETVLLPVISRASPVPPCAAPTPAVPLAVIEILPPSPLPMVLVSIELFDWKIGGTRDAHASRGPCRDARRGQRSRCDTAARQEYAPCHSVVTGAGDLTSPPLPVPGLARKARCREWKSARCSRCRCRRRRPSGPQSPRTAPFVSRDDCPRQRRYCR